jgi:hypothetical protein
MDSKNKNSDTKFRLSYFFENSQYQLSLILYIFGLIILYLYLPNTITNNDNYSLYLLIGVILSACFLFYISLIQPINNSQFLFDIKKTQLFITYFCYLIFVLILLFLGPKKYISDYYGQFLLFAIIIAVIGFSYIYSFFNLEVSLNQNFNYSIISIIISTIIFSLFLYFVYFTTSNIMNLFTGSSVTDNITKLTWILPTIVIYLIIILFFSLRYSQLKTTNFLPKLELLNRIFSNIFLLLFSILIVIYVIYYLIIGTSKISSNFWLNMILVFILCSLIYLNREKILSLLNMESITSIFSYIWNFDIFSSNIRIFIFIILLYLLCFFGYPYFINKINTNIISQGGNILVKNPIHLKNQTNIGNYLSLNSITNTPDKFNYNYALSFWIFLHSNNFSNDKYVSILNYGGKPEVSYNGHKNKLLFSLKIHSDFNQDLNEYKNGEYIDGNKIIYIQNDVTLQKWNQIVINYNGGTLDIFINGELVKSTKETIPYMTFDELIVGSINGTQGAINKVNYYKNNLSSSQIYYIYNLERIQN